MGVDGYSIGAMNGATLSTQITFVIGEDGTTGKVVEIVPAQTPTANEKDYTWEYVYSPKAQSFTVTYVDDTTGEELTDHDFTLSGGHGQILRQDPGQRQVGLRGGRLRAGHGPECH
ncbi:hypothetical protein AABB42_08405 [Limosilactobacillus fermentum]|uniref:hypothetical protein n=1 Tax=Limosilactobacillus fermentum TaxID=1613 RepID=UPI00335ED592